MDSWADQTSRKRPHNLNVAVDSRRGYYGAYFLGYSSKYLPQLVQEFPGVHYVGDNRVLFPETLGADFRKRGQDLFEERTNGRDGPNWSRRIKGHENWITDEHIALYEEKVADAVASVV